MDPQGYIGDKLIPPLTTGISRFSYSMAIGKNPTEVGWFSHPLPQRNNGSYDPKHMWKKPAPRSHQLSQIHKSLAFRHIKSESSFWKILFSFSQKSHKWGNLRVMAFAKTKSANFRGFFRPQFVRNFRMPKNQKAHLPAPSLNSLNPETPCNPP